MQLILERRVLSWIRWRSTRSVRYLSGFVHSGKSSFRIWAVLRTSERAGSSRSAACTAWGYSLQGMAVQQTDFCLLLYFQPATAKLHLPEPDFYKRNDILDMIILGTLLWNQNCLKISLFKSTSTWMQCYSSAVHLCFKQNYMYVRATNSERIQEYILLNLFTRILTGPLLENWYAQEKTFAWKKWFLEKVLDFCRGYIGQIQKFFY